MSYHDALAHLDALGVDTMKNLSPSTHRIEALLDLLNHPERQVPAIHITGTNGKTSTARIATALLSSAGLSVGTYTSPHLVSVRERIALSGEPIGASAFGQIFDHLLPYVEVVEKEIDERISYFELLTAMFFLWAAETPVDALVVEVGLGGRWDATNVLPSSVPVLTQVALDHTTHLGSDRVTIAKEKAGIIKSGAVVVTGERSPEVLAVIEAAARSVDGGIARIGKEFDLLENRVAFGGRYLSVDGSGGTYEGLFLPLHGAHQAANAALALEAVTRFIPAQKLDHAVVAEGLAATTAPGRLETVRSDDTAVPIVLDVAHNPDGMSAMITSLVEAFAFDRVLFVVGILADKDHKGMLAEMSRVPCALILTTPKSIRSAPLEDLSRDAEELGLASEVVEDVADAVKHAIANTHERDLICITGSHYVVGEARALLLPSAAI
ncbi:MAG: bifunctional folylpolyglutamate synthase/dihydrofolate synthase [Actinomycetota bacterium]|nr:bifunctional folylpolyglutamate synthase/dihydrofolate synthase [Actinomycetota bacterium]